MANVSARTRAQSAGHAPIPGDAPTPAPAPVDARAAPPALGFTPAQEAFIQRSMQRAVAEALEAAQAAQPARSSSPPQPRRPVTSDEYVAGVPGDRDRHSLNTMPYADTSMTDGLIRTKYELTLPIKFEDNMNASAFIKAAVKALTTLMTYARQFGGLPPDNVTAKAFNPAGIRLIAYAPGTVTPATSQAWATSLNNVLDEGGESVRDGLLDDKGNNLLVAYAEAIPTALPGAYIRNVRTMVMLVANAVANASNAARTADNALTSAMQELIRALPPRLADKVTAALGKDNIAAGRGTLLEVLNAASKAIEDAVLLVATNPTAASDLIAPAPPKGSQGAQAKVASPAAPGNSPVKGASGGGTPGPARPPRAAAAAGGGDTSSDKACPNDASGCCYYAFSAAKCSKMHTATKSAMGSTPHGPDAVKKMAYFKSLNEESKESMLARLAQNKSMRTRKEDKSS